MHILLWNQDWFAAELRQFGHTVTTMGFSPHLEVPLEAPIIHIEEAVKRIPGGIRPDLIVVHDNSAPVSLDGLYETDIPSIFYSVDTHHHADLHRSLAWVFDRVLVAQKDYIPLFEADGVHVEWLPLWASQLVEPSESKKNGAVFVGTLKRHLNPDRVDFFERLQAKVDMVCTTGDWTKIFPESEIVINQTVKGDLNFRVFEAMGSGALLLTESSPNGLFDLFSDGEHLVTYPKGDVDSAAARIKELLSDPARCRRIAAAGRAEIIARHRGIHRTEKLLETARNLPERRTSGNRFRAMENFSVLGRRLMKLDAGSSCLGFSIAIKLIEQGLKGGEPLSSDLACHAALAAIRYDQLTKSTAGDTVVRELYEAFPSLSILALTLIRNKLNTGHVSDAAELARRHFSAEPREIFQSAEVIVQQLLDQI